MSENDNKVQRLKTDESDLLLALLLLLLLTMTLFLSRAMKDTPTGRAAQFALDDLVWERRWYLFCLVLTFSMSVSLMSVLVQLHSRRKAVKDERAKAEQKGIEVNSSQGAPM